MSKRSLAGQPFGLVVSNSVLVSSSQEVSMAHQLRQLAQFLATIGRIWALSLMALGLSVNAWSLTLGHPNLLSHQGEPLNVEIELLAVSADEANGLSVSMAHQNVYQDAHAEWDPSLENTQVQMITLKGERRLLRISGRNPVGVSFVELLLEFHWATGSDNKEIGLLLDSASSNTKITPQGTEIRIVAGDTAGEIAERFLDASTNLNQMLVALLRSNPKAFVDHNVNRMLAGETLSIPSVSQANAVSLAQASQEVELQNIDFAKYRESILAKVSAQSASNSNPKGLAASGLVSQKSKALNTPNKDQLKLSQPNGPSSKSADQLAKAQEAKQNAERAKEIENNINELTQIANEQRSWSHRLELLKSELGHTFQAFWNNLPGSQSDLNTWLHHPLAPVVGGLALTLLVLGFLMSSRHHAANESPLAGSAPQSESQQELHLPPEFESHNPFSQGIMQSAFAQAPASAGRLEQNHDVEEQSVSHAPSAVGSELTDHIKLDFDLDLPHLHEPEMEDERHVQAQAWGSTPDSLIPPIPSAGHTFENEHSQPRHQEAENPLEVRFDLAQELWQVGQHHTARAIVQEIAQQATGELLEQAHAWLAQKG
jgi:FimV-like protein